MQYHALDAVRLGTTVQVRDGMLPADRAAFDEHRKRSLDELRIDAPVREQLRGVAEIAFLPWDRQRERRLDRLLVALRVVPRLVWRIGYQVLLCDMRARDRIGRRIV